MMQPESFCKANLAMWRCKQQGKDLKRISYKVTKLFQLMGCRCRRGWNGHCQRFLTQRTLTSVLIPDSYLIRGVGTVLVDSKFSFVFNNLVKQSLVTRALLVSDVKLRDRYILSRNQAVWDNI